MVQSWLTWMLSGRADPREIVPQQVDDHHVLGPIFFACATRFGRSVDGRIAGARPGSFDRPRLHLAGYRREKSLGRGAEDLKLAQSK